MAICGLENLIGAVINKRRWKLSYTVNGQPARKFPLAFYSAVSAVGLMMAVWWYTTIR